MRGGPLVRYPEENAEKIIFPYLFMGCNVCKGVFVAEIDEVPDKISTVATSTSTSLC